PHGPDQAVAARMADPRRPRRTVRVQAGEVEVAARIDGEVLEVLELPGCQVDGHALGDSAQVENHRSLQRNRPSVRVHPHIPEGHVVWHVDRGRVGLPGTMVTVEPGTLEPRAYCRVDRTAAGVGHGNGKTNHLEQCGTDGYGQARSSGELHQFTRRI